MNPCILCGVEIRGCPAYGTWHQCGGYIRLCTECAKGGTGAKVKAIVVHERGCKE